MQRNLPKAARGGPVVLRPVSATPCINTQWHHRLIRLDDTLRYLSANMDAFATSTAVVTLICDL